VIFFIGNFFNFFRNTKNRSLVDLYDWQKKQDQRLLQSILVDEKYDKLTFTPKISKKSRMLTRNRNMSSKRKKVEDRLYELSKKKRKPKIARKNNRSVNSIMNRSLRSQNSMSNLNHSRNSINRQVKRSKSRSTFQLQNQNNLKKSKIPKTPIRKQRKNLKKNTGEPSARKSSKNGGRNSICSEAFLKKFDKSDTKKIKRTKKKKKKLKELEDLVEQSLLNFPKPMSSTHQNSNFLMDSYQNFTQTDIEIENLNPSKPDIFMTLNDKIGRKKRKSLKKRKNRRFNTPSRTVKRSVSQISCVETRDKSNLIKKIIQNENEKEKFKNSHRKKMSKRTSKKSLRSSNLNYGDESGTYSRSSRKKIQKSVKKKQNLKRQKSKKRGIVEERRKRKMSEIGYENSSSFNRSYINYTQNQSENLSSYSPSIQNENHHRKKKIVENDYENEKSQNCYRKNFDQENSQNCYEKNLAEFDKTKGSDMIKKVTFNSVVQQFSEMKSMDEFMPQIISKKLKSGQDYEELQIDDPRKYIEIEGVKIFYEKNVLEDIINMDMRKGFRR